MVCAHACIAEATLLEACHRLALREGQKENERKIGASVKSNLGEEKIYFKEVFKEDFDRGSALLGCVDWSCWSIRYHAEQSIIG